MNRGTLSLLWVATVVIAWFVGFEMGNEPEDKENSVPVVQTSPGTALESNPAQPEPEVQALSADTSPYDRSAQNQPVPPPLEDISKAADETDHYDEQGQRLNRLGEAFNQAGDQANTHNDMRKAFNREFNEHELDLTAQTNFTDFLQLHEKSPLIDLHQIRCSAKECQLLGQYEGEHKEWAAIVEEMKDQEWWEYRGTSSSSSSHDGVTFFNLYIDKGEDDE